MRVLIGVDGSSGSSEAVALAGKLLAAEKDETLLYYSPPRIKTIPSGDHDPTFGERARDALATAVFDQARQQLPDDLAGNVQTIVGIQKPGHGLLLAADEYKVDLIVVGARGAGPIERLVLGSVGRAVVHSAAVPVLVVRPRADDRTDENLRVLLASDGSDTAKSAAKVLHDFTWPAGASGRVITVIESMLAGHVPEWLEKQARQSDTEAMAKAWVEQHDQEKQEARDAIVALGEELPEIFHGHEPIVAEGHPAEKILEAIANESVDLVVVRARGLGWVARLVLGSTSEQLLANAPCSVIVVHQPEKP